MGSRRMPEVCLIIGERTWRWTRPEGEDFWACNFVEGRGMPCRVENFDGESLYEVSQAMAEILSENDNG